MSFLKTGSKLGLWNCGKRFNEKREWKGVISTRAYKRVWSRRDVLSISTSIFGEVAFINGTKVKGI